MRSTPLGARLLTHAFSMNAVRRAPFVPTSIGSVVLDGYAGTLGRKQRFSSIDQNTAQGVVALDQMRECGRRHGTVCRCDNFAYLVVDVKYMYRLDVIRILLTYINLNINLRYKYNLKKTFSNLMLNNTYTSMALRILWKHQLEKYCNKFSMCTLVYNTRSNILI